MGPGSQLHDGVVEGPVLTGGERGEPTGREVQAGIEPQVGSMNRRGFRVIGLRPLKGRRPLIERPVVDRHAPRPEVGPASCAARWATSHPAGTRESASVVASQMRAGSVSPQSRSSADIPVLRARHRHTQNGTFEGLPGVDRHAAGAFGSTPA